MPVMPIEVTIRQQDAPPGIKRYAELRATKLVEEFPRIESVRVVVDMQRHMYEAQVVAQQKNLTAVGSKEFADNARARSTRVRVLKSNCARRFKRNIRIHGSRAGIWRDRSRAKPGRHALRSASFLRPAVNGLAWNW